MSRDRSSQPEPIAANLTPMIDVTFLLIIFFVLVSQIVEVENADLDLPRPEEAASELPGDQSRIVINVLRGAGGDAVGYRMSNQRYMAELGFVFIIVGKLGVGPYLLRARSSYVPFKPNAWICVDINDDCIGEFTQKMCCFFDGSKSCDNI